MSLYQSHKLDNTTFIKKFTLRTKEFQEISKILHEQGQHSLQHILITGKRGMGKSTLLRRVAIEAEEKLQDKLIPIYLGTEQYQVSKLYKLWETILRYISNTDIQVKQSIDTLPKNETYEKNILELLISYIKKENKTLLLLIDNFDSILNNLNIKDQHLFREILIENKIQIIGNCMYYDEKFIEYDAPFYDFFKRVTLDRMSYEEIQTYFKHLAEIQGIKDFEQQLDNKSAKLKTLQVLCGGVPRTTAILFDILFKNSYESSIDYLHKIIDEVTPLYQSRMNFIGPVQKEILYHMALIWDRCTIAELKDKVNGEANFVGAQLKILEENGYVTSYMMEGYDRLKNYEIEERFFNIWILMSEAPAYSGERVLWLTKWLETFYEKEELTGIASKILHDPKIKDSTKLTYLQAITQSHKLDQLDKNELISISEKIMDSSNPEFKIWIENTKDFKIDAVNLLKKLKLLTTEKNYEAIISILKPFLEALNIKLKSKYELNKEILESLSELNFGLAYVYHETGRKEEAEKYYLLAIEKGHINALYNLAILYEETGRKEEAEKYYLLAIEKGHIKALKNLAILYLYEMPDKIEMAIEYYKKYIAHSESDKPTLSVFYLRKLGFDNAENHLREIIEHGIIDEYVESIGESLKYYIVFKQTQALLKFFQDYPELQDRYKVIYYCLLRYFKKEYPKLWQRRPSELKQPVEDLEQWIQEKQRKLKLF